MSWEDEKEARRALLDDHENPERVKKYAAALGEAVYKSCLMLVERRPLLAVELLRDFLFADCEEVECLAKRLAEVDPRV